MRCPVSLSAALSLILMVGGGCATPSTGHKLTWRTLSRGLSSGLTKPRRLVLRDEADYLKVWAEHAADATRMALPPAADFPREMVIVVALGDRPTGGYLVEVIDVELRGRTLRVLVGEHQPAPGAMQIQQPTQPFQFIALPAVAARVEFRKVREAEVRAGPRKARPGTEGQEEDEGSTVRPPPRAPIPSPKGAAAQ